MGHLYSKVKSDKYRNKNSNNSNSGFLDIKIESLEVKIDNKPTQIDENSKTVIKYRTPHFR